MQTKHVLSANRALVEDEPNELVLVQKPLGILSAIQLVNDLKNMVLRQTGAMQSLYESKLINIS
jgi:hypothetical protein